MQKINKLAHVAKVVALCLPPVMMSLIGLAALSRKKGGADGIVSAWVIPTDEERMIALHTWRLLKENETGQKHARTTETAR